MMLLTLNTRQIKFILDLTDIFRRNKQTIQEDVIDTIFALFARHMADWFVDGLIRGTSVHNQTYAVER